MSVHFPAGFDFTSPDLWSERRPEAEFAELRRSAPVWWQDIPPGTTGFDDGGFWVVSKLEDIKAISRNPKQYSNWENGAIVRFGPEIEREQIDMQRMLLLNMDPPQHTKTRRIISRGFTPKAVQSLHDALAERAEQIVHYGQL